MLPLPQHSGPVSVAQHVTEVPAVAFSPDGKRVAAAFPSDGFTGIWRVPEPQEP